MGSDSAVQKLPHGFSHCLNGMGAQLHGFSSLPKPGKHQLPFHDDSAQEACYVLPRGFSPEAPSYSGIGDTDLENEEVYTFKTPCNTLATMHSNERVTDNYDLPTPPGSFYQIPRTFDKNHNSLTPSSSESSCAPPPRPPKPNQGSEGRWGSPKSVGSQNGEVTSAVSVIPRRNTLPAVENIRLHRGTLFLLLQTHLLKSLTSPVSCFQMQLQLHHFIHLWFCGDYSLPFSSPTFSFSFPFPLSLLYWPPVEQRQTGADMNILCAVEGLMKLKPL